MSLQLWMQRSFPDHEKKQKTVNADELIDFKTMVILIHSLMLI